MSADVFYYELGINIAKYSSMMPILIGLYKIRGLDFPMRLFWLYQILSLSSDLVGDVCASYFADNRLVFAIFCYLQSTVFLLFYYSVLGAQPAIRRFVIASLALSAFTGFWSIYALYAFTGVAAYPFWVTLTFNLPLIGFSLFQYYRFMVDMKIPKLLEHPLFWANTTVFFYFSTTLIFFVFRGLDRTGTWEFSMTISWTNIVAVFLSYVLAGVAFLTWSAGNRRKLLRKRSSN